MRRSGTDTEVMSFRQAVFSRFLGKQKGRRLGREEEKKERRRRRHLRPRMAGCLEERLVASMESSTSRWNTTCVSHRLECLGHGIKS